MYMLISGFQFCIKVLESWLIILNQNYLKQIIKIFCFSAIRFLKKKKKDTNAQKLKFQILSLKKKRYTYRLVIR